MTEHHDGNDLREALEAVTPPAPHLRHTVMAAVRDAARPAPRRRAWRLALPPAAVAAVLVAAMAVAVVERAGPFGATVPAGAAPLALPRVTGWYLTQGDTLALGPVASATDGWVVQRHDPAYQPQPGGEAFSLLYRTGDGGRTWQRKLRFEGEYDRMRLSPDGRRGVVWGPASLVPPCTSLPGDCASAPKAAPGILYRTEDGGDHWSEASPTPAGLSFYAMDFLDPDHGWAVLHPPVGTTLTVYATSDGGRTWRARGALRSPANVVIPSTLGSSRRLQFSDADHGLFSPVPSGPGALTLLVTGDGGATWQRTAVAAPQGAAVETVGTAPPTMFADGTGLLPVWTAASPLDTPGRSELYVYSTADHGRTWRGPRAALSSAAIGGDRVADVRIIDARHWWVVSRPSSRSQGPEAWHVSSTADGGRTWTAPLSSPPSLMDLAGHGGDVGWGVYQPWNTAAANLAVTSDGGSHWTAVDLPPAVDR
jgi:photosystem II stability/assembly factor-like uncharacterized protein